MGTGELVTLPLVSRGVALLLKEGHHTHLNIFLQMGLRVCAPVPTEEGRTSLAHTAQGHSC